MAFTGKDLLDLGYTPGSWFKDAIALANKLLSEGKSLDEIRPQIDALAPAAFTALRGPGELSFGVNIEATSAEEQANVAAVLRHMTTLMRVPTVEKGAIMPDACPSGSALGTIPVGGIVATRNAIHPGFHSADICCSVAISILGDVDPKAVLDVAMAQTHFGPGGRPREKSLRRPDPVRAAFAENVFLKDLEADAIAHFGTQGDGNHFLYVGRIKSTGEVALVTHHGSRKPGAMLYKRGMAIAEKWRKKLSPETPSHSAWIPADEPDGRAYWQSLQAIRLWTRESHYAIHELVSEAIGSTVKDRFWNEHNFVFERDSLFYHAKGATPAWSDFAADSSGLTLIPLNMAEPILITRGLDAANGIGFAPHGAGRNASRTAFLSTLGQRSDAEIIAEQAPGIDVRSFCGVPDLSELPFAYKNATAVRKQIGHFGLAEVVDEVVPFGCIMAGDWQKPFREKRARERAAKTG
jgi:tRNA-splicing ligase RtcB (3'-phosphate/5'-hydroxy nucleic acid ligase)